MKPHRYIGIVFFIVMVACTRPDGDPVETRHGSAAAPELSAIDSLMWQRPDSALMLLLPCLDTCCAAEYDRHYANLLLAELLYKNYEPQENRAQLQQAVTYFDASANNVPPTTAFLAARAHYINGVGYYEQDSAVPACKEYIKALETMENRFTEKDLVGDKARFMALTYTHLTSLFSDLYLHEQAIYFGKKALEFYDNYNVQSWHKAWMLDELGSQYDMLEQLDSADYYYSYAFKVLQDTNSLLERDITTHQAYLLYKRLKNKEIPLSQLYSLLGRTQSDREYAARCLTIGDIYYHEQLFDSAYCYLYKVLSGNASMDSKQLAAEWLQDITTMEGDTVKATGYALFRSQYAKIGDTDGELHSLLIELGHDYERKKQDRLIQKKSNRNARLVTRIVVLLLVLCAFAMSLFFANKIRNIHLKKQNEEMKQKYDTANRVHKQNLETEQYLHKISQASLSGKLKRSHEDVKELQKQIEILKQEREKPERVETRSNGSYKDFRREPICQHIVSSLMQAHIKTDHKVSEYKKYALSASQYRKYLNAINKHCIFFEKKLRDGYPNLTDAEKRLCFLYLLDLKDKEIAVLLQVSYQSLGRKVRSLKSKMNKEKDTLPAYLIGLAFPEDN